MSESLPTHSDREDDRQPFAPVAITQDGNPNVCCERCASPNIELDGWDIDKCLDCGHWRYR